MSFITNYYHNACSVRDTIVFPLFTVPYGRARKTRIRYVWMLFFFEMGGKNLRCQKYLDTCRRGLRVASLCISFHGQYPNCRQTEVKKIGCQKSVVMGKSMLAYTSISVTQKFIFPR